MPLYCKLLASQILDLHGKACPGQTLNIFGLFVLEREKSFYFQDCHLEEIDELRFVDHSGGKSAFVRRLVDDHRVFHVVPSNFQS
jgi:hypothetical protein